MTERRANRPKAVVAWSSGKDSAYALWQVRRSGDVEVVGLLTTLAEDRGRVTMHHVPEVLLDGQVERLGLPCTKVRIPSPCPNEVYEERMGETVSRLRAKGVDRVVFGDLFLDDVRRYREERLARVGMRCEFPLWMRDTAKLAKEMVDAGVRAVVVCVDPNVLDRSFLGRVYDRAFLEDLPEGVDPCGERGEFHTLVTAGPMFDGVLEVEVGDVAERDGFSYLEVT